LNGEKSPAGVDIKETLIERQRESKHGYSPLSGTQDVGLRKHEDEFNSGVMTANFKVAGKLCCECVYQSHSQAFP